SEAPETVAVANVDLPALSVADSVYGGMAMWDRVTPSDIDQAKNDLVSRRAEILARHAEELKGLEADQAQIETLERIIKEFSEKFKLPSQTDNVVTLDRSA